MEFSQSHIFYLRFIFYWPCPLGADVIPLCAQLLNSVISTGMAEQETRPSEAGSRPHGGGGGSLRHDSHGDRHRVVPLGRYPSHVPGTDGWRHSCTSHLSSEQSFELYIWAIPALRPILIFK